MISTIFNSDMAIALGYMLALGVVLAALLVIANRFLFVFQDPRIDEVESALPHTNCGACGEAGCRIFAEKLIVGDVQPGQCTVNSHDNSKAIADYLGVELGGQEKRVARLACAGGKHVAQTRALYTGLHSCRGAAIVGGGGKGCAWGCLGMGDCEDVCELDAIAMDDHGLPIVDSEKCTACGDCYSVCPDSAIPGLVNSISEIFNSTIMRIERGGNPTRFLRREVRSVEKKLRDLIEQNGEEADVSKLIDHAVLETLAESELQGKERESLEREFTRLMETIGDFRFSITKPYYSTREKRQKGSGGLFSVTINPYTCKGCMECIDVCDDEALIAVTQTEESIERMRREWNYWLDLPSTNPDFIRIDDLDEKIGALETLLLDKRNYNAMLSGDGACLGCGEKTSVHLFTATVTALLQPRIQNHLEKIDGLINQLETRVCMTLADNIDLDNTEAFRNAIDSNQEQDLTLGTLSHTLEEDSDTRPLNQEWLKEITALLDALRDLKWKYTEGQTKQGRAEMGIINATGCTSVWGSTFPYNPYPFPWANHLFQDAPSMAMGIFEGHMAKMAGGFKAIRKAELILADKYDPAEHNNFFTYFNWKQFSDDEWHLCPPVVAVGGDGAMYDIGF